MKFFIIFSPNMVAYRMSGSIYATINEGSKPFQISLIQMLCSVAKVECFDRGIGVFLTSRMLMMAYRISTSALNCLNVTTINALISSFFLEHASMYVKEDAEGISLWCQQVASASVIYLLIPVLHLMSRGIKVGKNFATLLVDVGRN